MKHKSVISYYSLIAAIIAATPAMSAVRVNNISRSNARAYNQVNELRMGTVAGNSVDGAQNQAASAIVPAGVGGVTTALDSTGAVVDLPITIANADLAQKIAMGQTVGRANMAALDACARIYPDGEFAWDTPTAGAGRGGAQTCVAVVELRAVNGDGMGNDVVMARANVAADDVIRCNIDDFPEYGYTTAVENFEFPADREPTVDDVIAQMNQEQKQNAGLKIAAGAVVGALGGNIAGKSALGSDSIVGTNKEKVQSSAVGALAGAALMAGNSYAGKVGGDVILSTGVNAAAGGVIGNMMASGNSVLRIESCDDLGGSCLWGTVQQTKEFTLGDNDEDNVHVTAYYDKANQESIVCRTKKDQPLTGGVVANNCTKTRLLNIYIKDTGKSVETLDREQWRILNEKQIPKFEYDEKKGSIKPTSGAVFYLEISSASEPDGLPVRAMVPGVSDKAFGFTSNDWNKWLEQNKQTAKMYGRDGQGKSTGLLDSNIYKISDFRPSKIDAEDGGIIDINNKARLKSTLTGAGVGGAMGGFVGYQGAQSDINDRYVSEVRNYKDSLTSVYCITGKRYLGQYNETIKIPALNIPDAE
ncbi:hypothetical protein HDR61_00445 [bacterium]|nr:hypothetical protein [bacterium]